MATNSKPTADSYPLPQLFWSDVDGEQATMSAPVYVVSVVLVEKDDRTIVDTTTMDELPNALALRRYGSGLFECVARAETGKILARRMHRVKVIPEPTLPLPAASSPAAPVPMANGQQPIVVQSGGSGIDPLTFLKVISDANAQVVQAITSLSAARIGDAQDMYKALLAQKLQTTPGGSGEVAAYERGMKKVMDLLDSAREAVEADSGETPDDIVAKVNAFTAAMAEFRKLKNESNGQPATGHA